MRKLVFGLLVLITACGGEIEFASERMEDHPDCPGGGVEIIMDGETEVICDGQDGAEGPEGPAGQDGKDGEVCTLEGHDADGVMEIDCPDGTDPAQLPSVGWCDVYHGDFEPDDIVELVDFYRAGCTEVTGDVYINGGWRTPHFNALEDLHYFDHLEEVGGALSLRNLDNLTVIEEFPALGCEDFGRTGGVEYVYVFEPRFCECTRHPGAFFFGRELKCHSLLRISSFTVVLDLNIYSLVSRSFPV